MWFNKHGNARVEEYSLNIIVLALGFDLLQRALLI